VNAEQRLVIDASVIVKWFVEEPDSSVARQLQAQGKALLAPELLILETTNAFLKKLRRGDLSQQAMQLAVEATQALVTFRPDRLLFDDALTLAKQHTLTIFDALYVELALSEGCQLVTADQRLVNASRSRLANTVLSIWEYPSV
jgi:predicted nucleic acid-binding protein